MREEDTVVENAAEVMTIEEPSEKPTTINDHNGSRKRRKGNNKQKGRTTKARRGATDDPIQMIKARFAACGRCCYFLGSYTSTHGDDELAAAAHTGLSDWMTLTWDQQTRNLVHKAFGVQLDVDYYFYEGCCVSCYRQFSFKVDEVEGIIFRVQLQRSCS